MTPEEVHRAGAAYWGSVACWHYQMLAVQRTDVRAAKAEALALLALNHAWSVVGRDQSQGENHESTGTRDLPRGLV